MTDQHTSNVGSAALGNCSVFVPDATLPIPSMELSCVTLDNCSCIVLGNCVLRCSTSSIHGVVPSAIRGFVPPASLQSLSPPTKITNNVNGAVVILKL